SLRQQLAREGLAHHVDQPIVSLAQFMDRSNIRMLDLDRVAAALPQQSECTRVGRCVAEEDDRDLEPGRVLGTVERSEGGVPQPLPDADPGTEGPAHQAGLAAGTSAR